MRAKTYFRYLYYFLNRGKIKAPKFNSNSHPHVALCLYGIVGDVKGKAGNTVKSSKDLLEQAYSHYKDKIFAHNPNVDVFVHTWSVDLKEPIEKLYKPKKAIYQKQVEFNVAPHIQSKERRAKNHYSRWYSTKRVIEAKAAYEKENEFKYDLVLVTRFDLAFLEDIHFNQLDPQYFYAANWYSKINLLGFIPLFLPVGAPYAGSGLADLWFIANSENMDKFGTLYDHINEYTLPGKCAPSQFGISNHTLSGYHLKQIGLLPKLRLKYNRVMFYPGRGFNYKGVKDSTPLVRRYYHYSEM